MEHSSDEDSLSETLHDSNEEEKQCEKRVKSSLLQSN